MATFNPLTDAHFSLETFDVMPTSLLEHYQRSNMDAITELKAKEQDQIRKTSELLKAQEEDHVWNDVTLESGQKVKMAWVDGVSSMYAYVDPASIEKTGDGKMLNATAQVGSFSQETSSGTAIIMRIKNLDGAKVGETAEQIAVLIAGSVGYWFGSLARQGILATIEQMTFRFANYLMRNGRIGAARQIWMVEELAPVLGTWGSGFLARLVAPTLGALFVWGAIEIVKYVFEELSLTGYVYNFDTKHDWNIGDIAGVNEERVGNFTNLVIKHMEPAGKKLIPGLAATASVGTAAVYFRTIRFVNEHRVAGGFTVTAQTKRVPIGNDPQMSFNWAFKVEKMAKNSMALASSTLAALDYKNHCELHSTKELQISEPLHVSMSTAESELLSAKDDQYTFKLQIGSAPSDPNWAANLQVN